MVDHHIEMTSTSLHILLLFLFFYHIYALVLFYFYIIFIFILLHCPLSRPDLIYVSLLIIPCIIYYVTNKRNLEPWVEGAVGGREENPVFRFILFCRWSKGRSLSPWMDLAFLQAGELLEQVSWHNVVTTDTSSTGWGATCNGQAASGLWTGPRLLWHINCLELWTVHLALRQFRPLLLGKHVLDRMDNTAAVSYINQLGGIRSCRMSQLARHLLLWSHTQFKSLCAGLRIYASMRFP